MNPITITTDGNDVIWSFFSFFVILLYYLLRHSLKDKVYYILNNVLQYISMILLQIFWSISFFFSNRQMKICSQYKICKYWLYDRIKISSHLTKTYTFSLTSRLLVLLMGSHMTFAPSIPLSLSFLSFSIFFCTYGVNSHRIDDRSVYKGCLVL